MSLRTVINYVLDVHIIQSLIRLLLGCNEKRRVHHLLLLNDNHHHHHPAVDNDITNIGEH
jgi:hypothetical protein